MFDISWNVLCPGCGGVLDTNATLKTVQKEEYTCALCAADYEPTLDEMVEVTFTVSPRIRKIAAHNPETLPLDGIFPADLLGSGLDLPEDYEEMVETSRWTTSNCRRAKRRSFRSSCRPSSSSSSSRSRIRRSSST